jgi:hypothetical protein
MLMRTHYSIKQSFKRDGGGFWLVGGLLGGLFAELLSLWSTGKLHRNTERRIGWQTMSILQVLGKHRESDSVTAILQSHLEA